MLSRHLPLARALEKANAQVLGGNLADDGVGEVGRAVGRDDDFEPLSRIVECQRVLDAAADHRLLVVRRDHQRNGRRLLRLAHGPRPHARQHAHRERIARVRPAERASEPQNTARTITRRASPGRARDTAPSPPRDLPPPRRTRGRVVPSPRGRRRPPRPRGSHARARSGRAGGMTMPHPISRTSRAVSLESSAATMTGRPAERIP